MKQAGKASQDIALATEFWTQNQDRGLCRRGLLQKIRPLALTNAAIATLRPAHINEKNKCRRSYLTAKLVKTNSSFYLQICRDAYNAVLFLSRKRTHYEPTLPQSLPTLSPPKRWFSPKLTWSQYVLFLLTLPQWQSRKKEPSQNKWQSQWEWLQNEIMWVKRLIKADSRVIKTNLSLLLSKEEIIHMQCYCK